MVSPTIASGAKQPPRVGGGHIVPADVHAFAADGERHVHAIVDHERHGTERGLDRAGAVDHDARVGELVAELHQGHAARGQHPAEIDKIVAARHLRIDNGVAAKIDL